MFHFSTVNYIFGSPGAGKTTVLAMIARWLHRKYKNIPIYANFPLNGTTLIEDEDVGYYNFGENGSFLLLDECGISYNNRDAANKRGLMQDKQRLQYWKLCRHYKCTIWVASQSWSDCDKKIRDLSQSYFLIKRSLIPCVTVIKPIYKKVDIDDNTHEPSDFYKIDVFLRWKWILRNLYYKDFDSYDAPILPPYSDKNKEKGGKE